MATIGGFSKVTNFFRESLIPPEPMPECPPPPDVIPAEEVNLGGLEMNPLEGTEFTLISTVRLNFKMRQGHLNHEIVTLIYHFNTFLEKYKIFKKS